jgi:hypothetical protein
MRDRGVICDGWKGEANMHREDKCRRARKAGAKQNNGYVIPSKVGGPLGKPKSEPATATTTCEVQ